MPKTIKHTAQLVASVGLLLATASCVTHVAPYKAKHRRYVPSVAALEEIMPSLPGRIFRTGNNLGSGTRTFRSPSLGDIVVVTVGEKSTAKHDATQSASKSSIHTASLTQLLGFMKKFDKEFTDFDPSALIALADESEFQGIGANSRVDEVEATVAAQVRQVFPNGNLFIEGSRVVLVHQDEVHYYVSGVCRPRDIDENNKVRSSLMLDVQVEITCRGPVCNASRQGWFSRLVDWVWPL